MRIAIVGAGAMGTLLGHGLCRAGHDVSVIDLPSRVAELQSDGKLCVVSPDGAESTARPTRATADYSEAGIHDVIVLATKAQDLPSVARGISDLTTDQSVIVTIQNGIPWWYLHGLKSDFGATRIQCLDPDGLLERHIDSSQIIGCVAYPAAMMAPDGRVHHIEGFRFPVGELDGSVRDRTRHLSGLFEDAGFKSRIIDDIRSEIWLKAWGAISINPISALTRATMVDICTFTETRELVEKIMLEVQDVAEAFGASFRHSIEKRIDGAAAVGAHKTSMLQDVECGRELELDALMLAAIELADLAGKEVPTIRNIYACAALLNKNLLSAPNQIEIDAP
jgi:2-dehydropantoate 2-reductase